MSEAGEAMVDDGVGLLRATTVAMVVADIGFLVYWLVVATGIVPPESMFAEYADPRVAAWNWSFLPLDLAASFTGLAAVRAVRRSAPTASARLATSLTLTATAGGMAVAFWAQRGQFDLTWWIPNLALLLFPLPMLVQLGQGRGRRRSGAVRRRPRPDDATGPAATRARPASVSWSGGRPTPARPMTREWRARSRGGTPTHR